MSRNGGPCAAQSLLESGSGPREAPQPTAHRLHCTLAPRMLERALGWGPSSTSAARQWRVLANCGPSSTAHLKKEKVPFLLLKASRDAMCIEGHPSDSYLWALVRMGFLSLPRNAETSSLVYKTVAPRAQFPQSWTNGGFPAGQHPGSLGSFTWSGSRQISGNITSRWYRASLPLPFHGLWCDPVSRCWHPCTPLPYLSPWHRRFLRW